MTQPSSTVADLLNWAKRSNLVDQFGMATPAGQKAFRERGSQTFNPNPQAALANAEASGKLLNTQFREDQSAQADALRQKAPIVLGIERGRSDISGDAQERRVGLIRSNLLDPQRQTEKDMYMAGIGEGGQVDRILASTERMNAQNMQLQREANNQNNIQGLIGNILRAGSMILPFIA
jgi:hypothetical protein